MSCNTCHGMNVRHCPDERHRDETFEAGGWVWNEEDQRVWEEPRTERLSVYWAQREAEEQGKPTDDQVAALISLAHTVAMWRLFGSDTELHDDFARHYECLKPLIQAHDKELLDKTKQLEEASHTTTAQGH